MFILEILNTLPRLATPAVVIVGILHLLIMLGELLPRGMPFILRRVLRSQRKRLHLNREQRHVMVDVVHNAAIYNGIVGAALLASAMGPPVYGLQATLLIGVIVAGLYGGQTLTRVTYVQASAGLVALLLVGCAYLASVPGFHQRLYRSVHWQLGIESLLGEHAQELLGETMFEGLAYSGKTYMSKFHFLIVWDTTGVEQAARQLPGGSDVDSIMFRVRDHHLKKVKEASVAKILRGYPALRFVQLEEFNNLSLPNLLNESPATVLWLGYRDVVVDPKLLGPQLKQLKNIRALCLEAPQLAGRYEFLQECQQLKVLYLDPGPTEAELRLLQEKLPNCKISFPPRQLR